MWRIAACSISLCLVTACPAMAAIEQFSPGQYKIGKLQQVCLTDNGTWYGTTFNFAGNWSPAAIAGHLTLPISGNYLVHSDVGTKKANTTFSLMRNGEIYWYDWFDDLSYSKFVINFLYFVKNKCDPPFTRRNKGATEFATAAPGNVAAGFKSGQYELGEPTVQEICLKDGGTWFGTTFNFSGQWIRYPESDPRIYAAIFGNYGIEGHKYKGFANDTITIGIFRKNHEPASADWYDWYDDQSLWNVINRSVTFVKSDCDPPFKGENTHAATE
jgi:hypothetical protein